jgi:hypothetical protein
MTSDGPILNLHYGQAVNENQRYPRPSLEAALIKRMTHGTGVKMFGLRRIGKSTMRKVLLEHFAKVGREVYYVDAQGADTLSKFLFQLSPQVTGKPSLIDRARNLSVTAPVQTLLAALVSGDQSSIEDKTIDDYWQSISAAIKAAALAGDTPPAIVIDEFPYLVDGLTRYGDGHRPEKANSFLSSLREWRDSGVSMMLTGSIGLTGLARRRGLSLEHISDLRTFDVPELTEEEARDFISSFVNPVAWSQEHTDAVLDEVSVYYPSFLVLSLLEVGYDDPCDVSEIPDKFSQEIRPELHDIFLEQFSRRFEQYLELPNNERDELIVPILKTILTLETPAPQNSITCPEGFTGIDLALALDMLADDGFLGFVEPKEGERLWSSSGRLVEMWWNRVRLGF